MALIRLGLGSQASGSLGGTVFSHNRFGAYIRARSIPVNPNTARQVAVRNFVTNLSQDWNNVLTQAQRDAWNEYAANTLFTNKLGEAINLTGLNVYVGSNSQALLAGLARVNDAPIIFTQANAEEALAVTASVATQNLSVTFDATQPWANEDLGIQNVFMGIPQNAGIAFFGGPRRFAGVILGDATTPPTSPATIAAPFVFGLGQRIWVATRIRRADGRYSERAEVNFLSIA